MQCKPPLEQRREIGGNLTLGEGFVPYNWLVTQIFVNGILFPHQLTLDSPDCSQLASDGFFTLKWLEYRLHPMLLL